MLTTVALRAAQVEFQLLGDTASGPEINLVVWNSTKKDGLSAQMMIADYQSEIKSDEQLDDLVQMAKLLSKYKWV